MHRFQLLVGYTFHRDLKIIHNFFAHETGPHHCFPGCKYGKKRLDIVDKYYS